MRVKFFVILLAAVFATLVIPSSASAQYYFGRNKIQYSRFDWKVLPTEHFRIYFYSGEDDLAEIAAHSIERSYKVLEAKFNMPIKGKTPVIIYSSPYYFDQTNVIPQLLPENVAGFTEFFKGRVVVPFNGSYHDFDRTLRHELVHVFMFKKLARVNKDHRKIKNFAPPLWFTEGIAEFWSGEWSSSAEMVAADAVLSGASFDENSIFSINGTYLMYKLGESLLHFMADEYGEDKILMLFENWWKGGSFREVVEYTFRVPLKEIFRGWRYHLKKKYFPTVADSDSPDMKGRPLTEQGFSVKPQIVRLKCETSEEKDLLVYKANKLGYSGIYLQENGSGKPKTSTLVKGERSPEFESLHLLASDISVNYQGKLAFASRHYEKDVLYIYDIQSREIEEKFQFNNLTVIQSPSWSPDASQIVFTGCRPDGRFDLYMYTIAEDTLEQLTDDVYMDVDAVFSPDGKSVVFSSDRANRGDRGYRNLYQIDTESGYIKQITYGAFLDESPAFSPDGRWMLFVSDRSGIPNIYGLNAQDEMFRIGNYSAGIQDPSFTPSGDSIIFSAYNQGGIRIYSVSFDEEDMTPSPNEPEMRVEWKPSKTSGRSVNASFAYESDFSFDFAQSAVAYDAFYGSLGGFQMAYSDILGNHQYYLLLYNQATDRGDFLSSFNVALTYINRERRMNYGTGVFHFYDEFDNRVDGIYDERQFGWMGLLSYPISKFRRIDMTMVLRKSEREVFYRDSTRHAVLSTNYISYIKDNSLWDMSGPIDGTRYNITLGFSSDLRSGKSFARLAALDFRKYIRLGKYSAFATRLYGFTSAGEEPQRLYLGGSWSLRGFDRRTFYGRNVALFSSEVRFPLINNLFINFPLGRIGFSGIRGAIFWDTGNAWDDDFDRFYGAVGFGARVALGYMAVLRFDFARTTDYIKLSNAWKFDFFFGWNF